MFDGIELAERRIFPAIDIISSATRREELLLSEEALAVSHALRRRFSGSTPADAMNQLLSVMRRTSSNQDLVQLVLKGA